MKRIKVAQNQFLALYRTESDSGSTTGFVITKPIHHSNTLLVSFLPIDWKNAALSFIIISDILKTTGLQKSRPRILKWLNRSGDFSAEIRRSKRVGEQMVRIPLEERS